MAFYGRKGLSELIAVVLIIAFVVAVAALVASFSTSFTRSQITKIQREGGATIDCSISVIEIDPDSVKISSSTLYVTVHNTGREEFTDVDVVFRNTSESSFQTAEINSSVPVGGIRTLQVPGFTTTVDRIIAVTECPGVTDTVENVSGTFQRVK